jgi:hypothetical protein
VEEAGAGDEREHRLTRLTKFDITSSPARVLRRAGVPMAIVIAAACASDGRTSLSPEIDYKLHRPTVPIPDSLWKAPAGSTPARGSYVYLEMDPSLADGVTVPHTIVASSGSIKPTAQGLRLTVAAADTIVPMSMSGTFDAMSGMLTPEVGYYPDLQLPAALSHIGAMDVTMNARPCASPSGWFAIDYIFFFNGNLTMLDLRFEQRCAGVAAPTRGQVHYRE